MGEFGNKFRKAREKKELSLDDVSNVTKIGARMLQAIEEERFDQLPGGVFNKGFIRAYARHLGLNGEDAVTDYLACLRQAQIDAHEVWEPQRGSTHLPQKPAKVEPKQSQPAPPAVKSQPTAPVEELPELQLPRAEHVRPRQRDFAADSNAGIPWRIVSVAAVVVILAVLFWTRRSHNTDTAAASTSPARPATQVEPAKLEPAKTVPAKVPVPLPKPRRQSSAASVVTQDMSRTSTSNSQRPQATLASPPPSVKDPATDRERDDDRQNDVIVRTFPKTGQATPQPSSKAIAPLTLVIRATETSWISVLADGQPVSQETLIAPAHTSIRATREIVARIGNAAGVTFLWNGQEVPADGAEAEVKTFVFDSTGMRVVPSTPAAAQNR